MRPGHATRDPGKDREDAGVNDQRLPIGRMLPIGLLLLACSGLATAAVAQETGIEDAAVTLASGPGGRAELWMRFENDTEHRLTFADGRVSFDGTVLGRVEAGSALAEAWRDFLRDHAGDDASSVGAGLQDLLEGWAEMARRDDAEGRTASAIVERLRALPGLGGPGVRTRAPDAGSSPRAQTVAGPDGVRLAIAPGDVELDELLAQLDRLRDALDGLGDAAAGAADRLALIVHDDFEIGKEEAVAGNLALLGGRLRLEGRVDGDVLVLDGDLVLGDGAAVKGDVLQVGGEVELAGDARIGGEIVSDLAIAPPTPGTPAAPRVGAGDAGRGEATVRSSSRRRASRTPRFVRNFARAGGEFMDTLSTLLVLGVLGLLTVHFVRPRLETVSDTIHHQFARSFAMGLAGEVLFFPALLVLAVLVITIPVIPFFVLAVGLAMIGGYLAVAHRAGEIFAQRRYRYEWLERLRRANAYYYVLNGLVLLLLPFFLAAALWVLGGPGSFLRHILTFVALVGTWVLITAGFGAVLLTRAGSRSVVIDWRAGWAPGAEPGPPGAEPGFSGAEPDFPGAGEASEPEDVPDGETPGG